MNMQHGPFDSFGKLLYLKSEKSHPAFTERRTSRPLFGGHAESEEQPLSSHSVHPPSHPHMGPLTPPLRPHLLAGGRSVRRLQACRENTLSCFAEEVRKTCKRCVGLGCCLPAWRRRAALCVQAAHMEVMEWNRVPAKSHPSASGTKKTFPL